VVIREYSSGCDCPTHFNSSILAYSAPSTHPRHNGWLTYGEPLHRLREFGTIAKEMDLIDEAPLSVDEMKTMICHM
jgi:hypothetical protein